MAFLSGLKDKMKLDEMAGAVAAKAAAAKEFAVQKQQSISESGMGKMAMGKLGDLAESASGVTTFISKFVMILSCRCCSV